MKNASALRCSHQRVRHVRSGYMMKIRKHFSADCVRTHSFKCCTHKQTHRHTHSFALPLSNYSFQTIHPICFPTRRPFRLFSRVQSAPSIYVHFPYIIENVFNVHTILFDSFFFPFVFYSYIFPNRLVCSKFGKLIETMDSILEQQQQHWILTRREKLIL